jgi:hypothetical protein
MLGEGDLGLHLAGVGIEHVAEAAGGSGHFLAADKMADLAHGFLLYRDVGRAGPLLPLSDSAACAVREASRAEVGLTQITPEAGRGAG